MLTNASPFSMLSSQVLKAQMSWTPSGPSTKGPRMNEAQYSFSHMENEEPFSTNFFETMPPRPRKEKNHTWMLSFRLLTQQSLPGSVLLPCPHAVL